MTARPILFSAPMIRALLDGRKTQTRRIVKPQPAESFSQGYTDNQPDPMKRRSYGWSWVKDHRYPHVSVGSPEMLALCPYGQPDDLLWVREAWCMDIDTRNPLYKADGQYVVKGDGDGFAVINKDGTEASPWLSPIHMPRWASRITLEITGVRVERLQEISEADAIREGIKPISFGRCEHGYEWSREEDGTTTAKESFLRLWESIHGPDSWDANPWVWALTFDVIRANVDEQKP